MAWGTVDIPDLDGMTALVTGSNTGIGFVISASDSRTMSPNASTTTFGPTNEVAWLPTLSETWTSYW